MRVVVKDFRLGSSGQTKRGREGNVRVRLLEEVLSCSSIRIFNFSAGLSLLFIAGYLVTVRYVPHKGTTFVAS